MAHPAPHGGRAGETPRFWCTGSVWCGKGVWLHGHGARGPGDHLWNRTARERLKRFSRLFLRAAHSHVPRAAFISALEAGVTLGARNTFGGNEVAPKMSRGTWYVTTGCTNVLANERKRFAVVWYP